MASPCTAVFALTNAAFAKLPSGTVDSLLKPEMKSKLTAVLTCHVVPGRLSAKDIMKAAKKNGGTAEFKTVKGGTIWVESKGNMLLIRDAKGNASKVTIQNVFQSNGVIHVIDTVRPVGIARVVVGNSSLRRVPGLVRAPNRQRCTAEAPAVRFPRRPFDAVLANRHCRNCAFAARERSVAHPGHFAALLHNACGRYTLPLMNRLQPKSITTM